VKFDWLLRNQYILNWSENFITQTRLICATFSTSFIEFGHWMQKVTALWIGLPDYVRPLLSPFGVEGLMWGHPALHSNVMFFEAFDLLSDRFSLECWPPWANHGKCPTLSYQQWSNICFPKNDLECTKNPLHKFDQWIACLWQESTLILMWHRADSTDASHFSFEYLIAVMIRFLATLFAYWFHVKLPCTNLNHCNGWPFHFCRGNPMFVSCPN